MHHCCSLAQKPEKAAGGPTAAPDPAAAPVLSATPDTEVQEAAGKGPWRRAKVVCDYDATNREEMSLMMNEVSHGSVFICFFIVVTDTFLFHTSGEGATMGEDSSSLICHVFPPNNMVTFLATSLHLPLSDEAGCAMLLSYLKLGKCPRLIV